MTRTEAPLLVVNVDASSLLEHELKKEQQTPNAKNSAHFDC
jgi:hypothetical protein